MEVTTVPQTESPQSIIQQCVSAGSTGYIEELYRLIKQHPLILDEIDSTPFLETPLHKAAAAGHVSFAVEIMALKPSLSRKLNEDGLTPLHLALEEISKVDLAFQQEQANPNPPLQQIQTEPNQASKQTQPHPNHALRQAEPDQQTQSILTHALRGNLCTMVFCLLDFDKDLARVKGKECWTPFHHAAKIGDLKLLIEILIICPKSILDLTANGETALHIALRYGQHKASFMLYNWIYLTSLNEAFWSRYKLRNWWSKANEEISKANKQISNIKRGLSKENYNEIVRMLCCDPTIGRSLFQFTEKTRNTLLVVVTLLITINFQVLLTPHGGTPDYANSPHVGAATMGSSYFNLVNTLNYTSLCFSIFATIFLLPKSPLGLLYIFPLGCLFAFFGISRNIRGAIPVKKIPKVLFLLAVGLTFTYFITIRLMELINFQILWVHLSCRAFSLRWRKRHLI